MRLATPIRRHYSDRVSARVSPCSRESLLAVLSDRMGGEREGCVGTVRGHHRVSKALTRSTPRAVAARALRGPKRRRACVTRTQLPNPGRGLARTYSHAVGRTQLASLSCPPCESLCAAGASPAVLAAVRSFAAAAASAAAAAASPSPPAFAPSHHSSS